VPTYMDQDGVYVAVRASVQLSKARWVDVRRACTAFVRTAALQLTNPSEIIGPKSPFGDVAHNLAGLVTPVAECARWFQILSSRTYRGLIRWTSDVSGNPTTILARAGFT